MFHLHSLRFWGDVRIIERKIPGYVTDTNFDILVVYLNKKKVVVETL